MNEDLKIFLKNLTEKSGVYKMLDENLKVIYVGKAKNLKKRVNSYFNKAHDNKTTQLVLNTHKIEVIITNSDLEAFLLENNLIKEFRPKYNIIFKDDKSYPYLILSKDKFPRLYAYRGVINDRFLKHNEVFGPFVKISSMRYVIGLISKIFPIRSCTNTYFKTRQRPCLMYQLQRCTAPCVYEDYDYQKTVNDFKSFANGKSKKLINTLNDKMLKAATNENFKQAIILREKLKILQRLQEDQIIDKISTQKLIHVIGIKSFLKKSAISILLVRFGKVFADFSFFANNGDPNSVLLAFLKDFYLSYKDLNSLKLVVLPDFFKFSSEALESFKLINLHAKTKIRFANNLRKNHKKLQNLALLNAEDKLKNFNDSSFSAKTWEKLEKFLNISISRIECFDISHFAGENTACGCVCFDRFGELRKDHRRFDLENNNNDCLMIYNSVLKRLKSLLKSNKSLPELLIIDGGKGQIHAAEKVLLELNLNYKIKLISLAKGKDRISGNEIIYHGFSTEITVLEESDELFRMLRYIRDKAHEYSNKYRIKKTKLKSFLNIKNVGKIRKMALLKHFNGLENLFHASESEIAKVSSINKTLAKQIYQDLKKINPKNF